MGRARLIGVVVGLLGVFMVASGKFLWIETPPAWDDPCTLVHYGHKRFDIIDLHWPSKCRDAGLIWLGTTGRLHAWLYVDLATKQEFEVCMTGGLSDRIHIFYDYAGHYLEPVTIPVWYMAPRWPETCKKSINGTMDLLFESPLMWIDYYTYVSFNITLIEDYQPKPQPPDKPWFVGEANRQKEEEKVEDIEEDTEEILADIDVETEDFSYW